MLKLNCFGNLCLGMTLAAIGINSAMAVPNLGSNYVFYKERLQYEGIELIENLKSGKIEGCIQNVTASTQPIDHEDLYQARLCKLSFKVRYSDGRDEQVPAAFTYGGATESLADRTIFLGIPILTAIMNASDDCMRQIGEPLRRQINEDHLNCQ